MQGCLSCGGNFVCPLRDKNQGRVLSCRMGAHLGFHRRPLEARWRTDHGGDCRESRSGALVTETRVVAEEVKEAGWVWGVFWKWNQESDLLTDGVWVSGR